MSVMYKEISKWFGAGCGVGGWASQRQALPVVRAAQTVLLCSE